MTQLPKFLKFILALFIFELILYSLWRLAFYTAFKDLQASHTLSEALYSFWIGFRFDAQLIAIMNLPLLLFGAVKKISLFSSKTSKYFWLGYIVLTNWLMSLVYIINIGYFDFFKKMVDNSIIRYFYDISMAMQMLVEGYPIISSSLVVTLYLVAIFTLFNFIYNRLHSSTDHKLSKGSKVTIYIIFVFLYIFAGYGKVELYPWRWSEAFYSSNKFLNSVASNPATYFLNTLKNKTIKFDESATKKYYDSVAQFLNIKKRDPNRLSLVREVIPDHSKEYTFNKPNIVFILGESTAYGRTSISNNPLNPTPFIKEMSDKGITYSRYYTPHSGTARSVWASMTGLADVERIKTSSRNPMVVNQHMILNSFENYEKFYFIGGSLSWGNVRGVISNVNHLNIYEEHNYPNSSRNDVWGISDVHLAHEVNDVLKKQTKPFFAYVQLSGNHSPNNIPDDNFGFKASTNLDKELLQKYGFNGSEDEFNGQKFLDFSVEQLITLAKKEPYFKNTIFIFVGDHGLPNKYDQLHEAEQTFRTNTLHTPLIIYAPYLIKHKKVDYPVSEVDIMATIGGLIGKPYINSTLGRDLLAKDFDEQPHYTYFMTHEVNPTINIMSKEFIFRVRSDGSEPRLFKYHYEKKDHNLIKKYPKIAKEMENMARGIFESTRYTRFNNSSEDVQRTLLLLNNLDY
ncbi:MAG: sulfatase-like hydrolase/transferase [Helicobacteraceae bacterium]|nr:sulfatase-like hydrolase/transferase [Helicobacteraceae bacterium]